MPPPPIYSLSLPIPSSWPGYFLSLGLSFLNCKIRGMGTWVAQSVKRQTLDFRSGHDLKDCEFKPHVGLCAVSVEPAWDSLSLLLSLSLSLSLPRPCSLLFSLKINKNKLKNIKIKQESFPSSRCLLYV